MKTVYLLLFVLVFSFSTFAKNISNKTITEFNGITNNIFGCSQFEKVEFNYKSYIKYRDNCSFNNLLNLKTKNYNYIKNLSSDIPVFSSQKFRRQFDPQMIAAYSGFIIGGIYGYSQNSSDPNVWMFTILSGALGALAAVTIQTVFF